MLTPACAYGRPHLLRRLFPTAPWRSRGGFHAAGARNHDPFHECPGRCGRDVPNRHFSCRWCWWRLPQAVQAALNATAGLSLRDPDRSLALTRAALVFRIQGARRG